MDQAAWLNRQENPVVFLYVQIHSDSRVFLAVEALEIDTSFIDSRFAVSQALFRYPAVIDQKSNSAALAGHCASLFESLQQQSDIKLRLCRKIEIVRKSGVLKIGFAKAVAT